MAIKLKVQDECPTRFALGDSVEMTITGNYEDLSNKPSINGVTLIGDKTTEDLHIEVSGGVTSWNGQTGDVVYTPPTVPVQSVNGQTGNVVLNASDVGALPDDTEFTIGYDEVSSVGSAVVGEAVTGEPNYTPSGTVTGTVTKEGVTLMTSGEVGLNYGYSTDYKLKIFGITFTPTTTPKNIVTGISNLTFNGNGVKFAVEQEQ